MTRLGLSGIILGGMIALQIVWLATIYLSKATSRVDKVRQIGIFDLLAGLLVFVVGGMLSSSWSGNIEQWLSSSLNQPLVLFGLCGIVASFAMLYASKQRIWPFDEEGNQNAAYIVAKSGVRGFFKQYSSLPWLGMQHPPLIPLLGGYLVRLFGFHLIILRAISVVFLLGSVVLTFQIGHLLYSKSIGLLAAALLLAFPLIWRLGSAAMLDMPATFWFALTIYLVLCIPTPPQAVDKAILAGIVVCLGMLTRYSFFLIYPVLLTFVIVGELSWQIFGLILWVSISLFSIWLVFASRHGIIVKQMDRLIIYSGHKPGSPQAQSLKNENQAVPWITRGWRMRLRLESLVSRLPSAVGSYNFILLGLGLWQLFSYSNTQDIILVLWICIPFTLLLILMPDHRYFMPIFPAFALGMARGIGVSNIYPLLPTMLALLLCAGNLYLFVDWQRQSYLFSRHGV